MREKGMKYMGSMLRLYMSSNSKALHCLLSGKATEAYPQAMKISPQGKEYYMYIARVEKVEQKKKNEQTLFSGVHRAKDCLVIPDGSSPSSYKQKEKKGKAISANSLRTTTNHNSILFLRRLRRFPQQHSLQPVYCAWNLEQRSL